MALGYTMALPTEDRYLQSKTEFEDKIAGLLGGNAAERVVFGDITTGAANDIEKATDIARRMVTEFGMSERLGPLSFGKRDELVFLGREIGEQRNYSRRRSRRRSTRRSGRSSTGRTSERWRSSRPIATGSTRLAEKLVAEETVDSEEFEKLFVDLPPKENMHGLPPRIVAPGHGGRHARSDRRPPRPTRLRSPPDGRSTQTGRNTADPLGSAVL